MIMTDGMFEITNKVSDLTRAAREALQYLNEDSVGYHYAFMLQTLESLNVDGELLIPLEKPTE